MVDQQTIEGFVSGNTLAMVGISEGGKGFGNIAYKELKSRGYRVLPVHPGMKTVQGDPCWRSLADLPEQVDRLLVVVSPAQVEGVLRAAADAGIRKVWLQQGAESPRAVEFCRANGMEVVHGHCILMFTEPVGGFHRFHRWIWRLIGKAPKRLDVRDAPGA
jgi:predicted CoA-binding protein